MPSADSLAKKLYEYLIAADCDAPVLRRLGWWDFLKSLPKTDDPRVIAVDAILALLVDDQGVQISHDDRILYGVLAFARAECGGDLPSQAIKRLTAILMQPPITREGLLVWFRQSFA